MEYKVHVVEGDGRLQECLNGIEAPWSVFAVTQCGYSGTYTVIARRGPDGPECWTRRYARVPMAIHEYQQVAPVPVSPASPAMEIQQQYGGPYGDSHFSTLENMMRQKALTQILRDSVGRAIDRARVGRPGKGELMAKKCKKRGR